MKTLPTKINTKHIYICFGSLTRKDRQLILKSFSSKSKILILLTNLFLLEREPYTWLVRARGTIEIWGKPLIAFSGDR